MGLQNILQAFVPKNKIFFELFDKHVDNTYAMSEKLVSVVSESNESKRIDAIAEIQKLEHENDEHTHQLFLELGKNFITPLDREDIHSLVTSLDDICDEIHGSARLIQTYKMDDLDRSIVELANCIHMSTAEVRKAVKGLRDLKNIQELTESCIKINSLESQADYIYESSMSNLFENEKDVVKILKHKDLLRNLELVTDKCEDAANVIESIVIKYA
jgi:uncharacterized protein